MKQREFLESIVLLVTAFGLPWPVAAEKAPHIFTQPIQKYD